MPLSMTGFAARKGHGAAHAWAWDLRSVNGKGLDLRLRLPDWVDGLELALRGELAKALGRGNVSLALKISRDGADEGEASLRLNTAALQASLMALRAVEDHAMRIGVTLGQASAADVLAVRGVVEQGAAEVDIAALRSAILADLPALLADFNAMRAAEGAALAGILSAQIDRIADLVTQAKSAALARQDEAALALRDAVARILTQTDAADPARLAQELALLAVKTDITEEIDRLTAHLQAARALLADTGPIGRKFDFLVQEFLREANTLCSKAQSIQLTRIGLDLKIVIDQMREQVQNVE
ncbi:MAG: YicC/YloC family endoribonuclease [Pseudomonadota bacterium]